MATSLTTVPTDRVFQRAMFLTRDGYLPPLDELARMAGEPSTSLMSPLMLRRSAIKLLGGLVVDQRSPDLAEHIQAMKGVKDARLHGLYGFANVREAMKYRRDLVKYHGAQQLELALR